VSEKRGYQRTTIWFPVTISLPETDVWAICRDASASGVLVSAEEPIEAGARVTLRFRLAPDKSKEHTIKASVVRHEQTRDELVLVFPYRIAFEFEEPMTDLLDALVTHASVVR
jgi:hypothetical protein